jgi:hypothetical protein
MRPTNILVLLLMLASGGCATRRPTQSFEELQHRLRPGHTVYVIDTAGRETRGKVVEVSSSTLMLRVNAAPLRIDSASVRQVQRYGDPLWNGALIGMGLGLPGLLIADPTYQSCDADPQKLCADSQIGQRVAALAVMGGLGAAVDALMRGRHQIYLAPGASVENGARLVVSPIVSARFSGLFVSLAF